MNNAYNITNFDDYQLERLMNTYGTCLLRMSYIYLKDSLLAEDAVQESFIKAYRHIKDISKIKNEKAWLIRITINTCKDMRRKAWFKMVDRSKAIEDLNLYSKHKTDFDDTVSAAVMALSTKYREVILLYYYQDMSIKEISAIRGIKESTINSRLNRARKQLEGNLEGWYFNEQF
ncbi:MAG: sigma-70 family RNA polymerase sigma factor [Christensenellaceae bacterium]|nr:sigma-70 family RNA polymerase sigma factor [Christensenellaceae bacterium]